MTFGISRKHIGSSRGTARSVTPWSSDYCRISAYRHARAKLLFNPHHLVARGQLLLLDQRVSPTRVGRPIIVHDPQKESGEDRGQGGAKGSLAPCLNRCIVLHGRSFHPYYPS